MSTTTPACPFDLAVPGAVDQLLSWHRSMFGDVRMEADGDADDSQDAGARETPEKPQQDRPQPPPSRSDSDDDGLRDAGRKALTEERSRARAEKKRADEAERRLQELERQQMSEQDRVAAERDDWRKKFEEQAATAAALQLAQLRNEVAAEKGLTLAQARRLTGANREELEADAEAFKSELAVVGAPPVPKPDPSAGSTGDKGKPTSVADAMARYQARNPRSGATP